MSIVVKRVLLVLAMASMMIQAVNAGPVSRELEDRGDDVGVPKQRPKQQDFFLQQSERLNKPQIAADQPVSASGEDPDLPLVQIPTQPAERADRPGDANADPAPQPNLKKVETPKEEIENPEPVMTDAEPVPDPAALACLQALSKIANARIVSSPDSNDAACSIPQPVELIATRSEFPIQFTRGLTLDCPFALTLAKFAEGTVQALARYHRGTPIVKILSGEGFVCRRRNNARTGKLSEHAFGNATDWVGFRFGDGSRLSIKDTSGMKPKDAAFLQNVRTASCGSFTTVLGPGANAAHATHFHFDLGRSKGKKNPYKICE